MTRDLTVSDSISIAADPMTVYRHVSDPTQMGRWSPENQGAKPLEVPELAEGMFFEGYNRRGPLRWVGRCRVLAAEPGRRFAFRTEELGLSVPMLKGRIATWEYTFEAVGDETLVTESWTDNRRWPDPVCTVVDPILTGGHSFAGFQRKNIATTLRRLKDALEA